MARLKRVEKIIQAAIELVKEKGILFGDTFCILLFNFCPFKV